ncbi:MAG: hypothetical protein IT319_04260 [Anaerolineae bacterium]|nr:hypothetical protein [Anaerolineae bacterium]
MPQLIATFLPELETLLPETHVILAHANLVVHDAVCGVNLEGSRGLAGGNRPDSDVDLTLIVDAALLPDSEPMRADLLLGVLQTTLGAWRSPVELDTAAVFDKGDCCGLRCLDQRQWDDAIVGGRGLDCFGIYKIQRGFDGYVTVGVELRKIYPMLVIWRREPAFTDR